MDDRKSLTESELSQQRFVLCVFVLLGSQSEPIKPTTKKEKEETAEGQRWWMAAVAQDLPGSCTLSQKAFSDLPTKFEARHQYFPASLSVTLDSFNLLWASVWLLTTLCEGRVERHGEAFTANTEHTSTQTLIQIHCKQVRFFIIFILLLVIYCVLLQWNLQMKLKHLRCELPLLFLISVIRGNILFSFNLNKGMSKNILWVLGGNIEGWI